MERRNTASTSWYDEGDKAGAKAESASPSNGLMDTQDDNVCGLRGGNENRTSKGVSGLIYR
jgi:hypothetical protein